MPSQRYHSGLMYPVTNNWGIFLGLYMSCSQAEHEANASVLLYQLTNNYSTLLALSCDSQVIQPCLYWVLYSLACIVYFEYWVSCSLG